MATTANDWASPEKSGKDSDEDEYTEEFFEKVNFCKKFQQTTKSMQNVPVCKEYMYTQTKQRVIFLYQGSHRLEKYLNLEGFL